MAAVAAWRSELRISRTDLTPEEGLFLMRRDALLNAEKRGASTPERRRSTERRRPLLPERRSMKRREALLDVREAQILADCCCCRERNAPLRTDFVS